MKLRVAAFLTCVSAAFPATATAQSDQGCTGELSADAVAQKPGPPLRSSDGAYDKGAEALVQGVLAAKDEARAKGFGQLEIGFNWAYRSTPQDDDDFWKPRLRVRCVRHGWRAGLGNAPSGTRRVDFRIDGRLARRDRSAPFRATLPARLAKPKRRIHTIAALISHGRRFSQRVHACRRTATRVSSAG